MRASSIFRSLVGVALLVGWLGGAAAADPALGVVGEGELQLLGLPDLKKVRTIGDLDDPVALAASPNGRWLLLADGDQDRLQLVDRTQGDRVRNLEGDFLSRPGSLFFSRQGDRAYVLSRGLKAVVELDTETWKFKRLLALEGPEPVSAILRADGLALLVVQRDGGLSEVNLSTWEVVRHDSLRGEISGVAWTPDQELLMVSQGPQKQVRILSEFDRSEVARLDCPADPAALVSAAGLGVVACGEEILGFDPRSAQIRWRAKGGRGLCRMLASPDGKLVLVASQGSRDLLVLDGATGHELVRVPVDGKPAALEWIP